MAETNLNEEKVEKTPRKRSASKVTKPLSEVNDFDVGKHVIKITSTNPQTGEMEEKKYLPASERVRWFRKACPEGVIKTDIKDFSINLEKGVCYVIITAEIYKSTADYLEGKMLSSGYSMKMHNLFKSLNTDADIIKSKFVQCGETEAVARALSFAGFNISGDLEDDTTGEYADSPVVTTSNNVEKISNTSAVPASKKTGDLANMPNIVQDVDIPEVLPANDNGLQFTTPEEMPESESMPEPQKPVSNVPTKKEVQQALSFKFDGIGNTAVKGKTFNEVFTFDSQYGTNHGEETVDWIVKHITDESSVAWKKAKEAALVIDRYIKSNKQ